MNIGFIEDTNLKGGTQLWVVEAIKEFISKGHNVSVIAPQNSFVALKAQESGADVFEYDWNDIPKNTEKYTRIWMQGLETMDVAICTVHPPREGFHCSVFAGDCIKKANLSTVLIPKTGTIVPSYKREFYIPNDSINLEIICIANFTRKYLIENYKIDSKKVHLIYQGVDVDRFISTKKSRQKAFEIYNLPINSNPVIAVVGSLEQRKGHEILFRALKYLFTRNSLLNIHVMVVGEGPLEFKLKQMVRDMNLEDNIDFFPFTDKPNYIFDRADFLVLPSISKEGLPNVILEAMSMGLPVIASDIAGISEIVKNDITGYTVTPSNPEELASAIEKLWSDKQKFQEIKKNATNLVRNNFDKKKQFEKFLNFFENICNK